MGEDMIAFVSESTHLIYNWFEKGLVPHPVAF